MSFGPPLVSITRCDLGQSFELNLDDKEYVVSPYPPKALSTTKTEAEALQQKAPQAEGTGKATLRIETTTTDTGERKQIFGHIARHVITTTRRVPLEGSKTGPLDRRTDGWYIDLDTHLSCDAKSPANQRAVSYLAPGNVPPEKIEFVSHGNPETGFMVDGYFTQTQTFVRPDVTTKQLTYTGERKVTLLEQQPLDPALFAVPGGFRRVAQINRNPPLSFSTQVGLAWRQFKDGVARIFE